MENAFQRVKSRASFQRGSGETYTIVWILVMCSLLSLGIIILNWVKSEKDARVERDLQNAKVEKDVRRGPRGFQVTY